MAVVPIFAAEAGAGGVSRLTHARHQRELKKRDEAHCSIAGTDDGGSEAGDDTHGWVPS